MQEHDMLVRQTTDEGILRLIMNDAGRRNALSDAMLEQLDSAIADARSDRSVRVILLAAEGPAFCAGHDLKEVTRARDAPDRGEAFFAALMTRCSRLMQAIVECPKPVIAEVSGIATAAGCQLVASCDLAVAADTASFSTPGVHIGLFCSTPMVALSRNIASKHAMEMLLTGEVIAAERAAEIGLVNRVVPADTLTQAATDLARTIASKSAVTVAIGKRSFYAQREMTLADAYEYAAAVMVENLLTRDAEEGIDAFIGKRAPKWDES